LFYANASEAVTTVMRDAFGIDVAYSGCYWQWLTAYSAKPCNLEHYFKWVYMF